MEFVIFRSGGKQYKAKIGDVVEVDKIAAEPNAKVELSDVLLFVGEDGLEIGKPTVDGASIQALVVDQKRGEKIRVAKFKAKARYRKVIGFRSHLTSLKVEGFNIPGIKAKAVSEKKIEKPAKTVKTKLKAVK